MHFYEFPYYAGFTAKKYFSIFSRRRLPYTVISVGNVTLGGTGKTPAGMAIAEEAKKRGFLPVILTRGYKGTAKGPCFVTRGDGPELSPEEAGDEPYLMAEKLRKVAVVKGGDRYEAGMFAIANIEKEHPSNRPILFILDDGFQHRRLYRDKDILLIDSDNPFGNGKLFPFGRLREPVGSLASADIIVLTKAKLPRGEDWTHLASSGGRERDDLRKLYEVIRQHNPSSPVFLAGHEPVSFRTLSGEKHPISWIEGRKIFAFCALGNPESFRRTIVSTRAGMVGFRAYRDHFTYSASDIFDLKSEAGRSGAGWIVTTEKDIIKIRKFGLPENLLVMEIDFAAEKGLYAEIFGEKILTEDKG
jgi:tetraacyldisaccharide 4'-kinase